MIYNNLLYFLVVILLFSTKTTPQTPFLDGRIGIPLLLLLLTGFWVVAGRVHAKNANASSSKYFKAEKKLSVLALLIFGVALYVVDIKYYLSPLSPGDKIPSLENIGGLLFFFLILSLMWLQARRSYERVFGRSYRPMAFVVNNIKMNLPIVLPWLVLSLVFDILLYIPFARVHDLLLSSWGDLIFFGVFVVFLMLLFPPMIKVLWSCKPMPAGPLLSRLESFCRAQDFSSPLLLWPLFEGQVITAAVMGILPRFRYLLITPALLTSMTLEEVDSVLAHEIGHVKRLHLVQYVLLFLGFSVLLGALFQPATFVLYGSDWFYSLSGWLDTTPETLLPVFLGGCMLVIMLVYFRFVFGYFIRNFERQADLHVFTAQGTSIPLVNSFEKIARLSGNIRNEKSWHHFGLGERIDFLESCEKDRSGIRRHHRKVYFSMAAYFLLLTACVTALYSSDFELKESANFRYNMARIQEEIRKHPGNGILYQQYGSLLLSQKKEKEAIAVYEKGLQLDPLNSEIQNNLAWLLLTAEQKELRDPDRALTLAHLAVNQKPNAEYLDTLALALWANGLRQNAILVEKQALLRDPKHASYYSSQIKLFAEQDWDSGK